MSDAFTFEVLVLSGKSQWTSVSRWENPTDAQKEARQLVAGKKHQGVKVMQEHYDENEDRFIEKTIFKKMKAEDQAPQYDEEEDDDFVSFDDYDDYDDEGNWLLPIAGIVTVLAVVLGVGAFFFDDQIRFSSGSKKGYYVYELPPVLTNISSGGQSLSLKMNLQLELDNSDDSKAVEFALAKIMESIIDELRLNDADDLRGDQNVRILRATLTERIQDAMGKTNLNGVLFKDIQVFE